MPVLSLFIFGLVVAGVYITVQLALKTENAPLISLGVALVAVGVVYIVIDFFIILFNPVDIPHNLNAGICIVIALVIQNVATAFDIFTSPKAKKRKNEEI